MSSYEFELHVILMKYFYILFDFYNFTNLYFENMYLYMCVVILILEKST